MIVRGMAHICAFMTADRTLGPARPKKIRGRTTPHDSSQNRRLFFTFIGRWGGRTILSKYVSACQSSEYRLRNARSLKYAHAEGRWQIPVPRLSGLSGYGNIRPLLDVTNEIFENPYPIEIVRALAHGRDSVHGRCGADGLSL